MTASTVHHYAIMTGLALAMAIAGSASAQTVDPHAGHSIPTTKPSVPSQEQSGSGMAQSGMNHSTMDHSTMDHSTMGSAPMDDGQMDHRAMGSMSAMPDVGTRLAAASPGYGEVLEASPQSLSLTLPHAMTLMSVSLSNAIGQRIPLSQSLPVDPVITYASPVPPLASGAYTVAWTAGTGTHTMSGTLSFAVN